MKVCLMIVRTAADGGPPQYLIARQKKLPGEPSVWSHYLLGPSLLAISDYTTDVRGVLDWMTERQGGPDFARMLRGKDVHALPPIAGHHPHLHAFVVTLSAPEADLLQQRAWKEPYWMTAEEALAIEPIDQDTAYGGVAQDSRRMLDDEHLALRAAIAWNPGQ